MTDAKFLAAAQRVTTPWKNGGGNTAEVIAFPPDADLNSFLWRLSIAEVATPGPFSYFAGIDRTLAVISGDIALTIDGAPAVRLDEQSAPLAFSGEATVDGVPLRGPVTDLNAMVRRDHFAVEMIALSGGETIEIKDETIVIVALAPLRLSHHGDPRSLDRLDAFACSRGAVRIEATPGTHRIGFAVRFTPKRETAS